MIRSSHANDKHHHVNNETLFYRVSYTGRSVYSGPARSEPRSRLNSKEHGSIEWRMQNNRILKSSVARLRVV